MKTGFHTKLKWLAREKLVPQPQPAPAISPEARPGWFAPQTAETLLATPLRQQLMKIIWQRTSLSGALFAELYQAPVARFAELVQLLPASEYHHHSHPGGLLDHTLEVMAFAAKLRQRHLLPAGAAPEDQAREAEAWTAGIIYAALLHDVGKIAVDIEVVTDDNQPWYPWQPPPDRLYRLKYHQKRDHQFHPVAAGLLAMQILPATALTWLAQYRELYESFLYCISGHYDRAGIMGELVQEADRASVAQFMGANASTALERPQPSLAKQMLTALKEVVQTQYKLNNPHSGSDGWLTKEALWLISKTTADRVRAWLLQQGVTSVPDSNVRLFDEMQAHGLIVATPEGKAVWSCDIKADSGWTPGIPLTLLKLSPSRFWSTVEERPALFTGTVMPVANNPADTLNAGGEQSVAPLPASENELTDLAFSLFAPQEAAAPSESAPLPEVICEDTRPVSPATAPGKTAVAFSGDTGDTPPAPGYSLASPPRPAIPQAASKTTPGLSGQHFYDWLCQVVQARKIVTNDVMARVHMVQGRAFLVSPGIFQLYVQSVTGETGTEWKKVQLSFQRLGLHIRGDDGINIFNCEVKGPRKTRQVKGYLLDKPEEIFGGNVPEDNPYLSIITQ
ncbi:TraI domain-containing protein [Salmonella enterica]|nr:TraI domain-containing protein [Salmonella enterica]EKS4720093.1 TraI domain-containing protein [Salmonella enterica]EKS4724549.1 TraI domain-containing protein [Salmonella enterica]EKS4738113.1 TraI domain-containing protein [Salmonella enterica]EKS4775394.1 TraI domain-containing protein [Salmonella enterica]